MLTTIRKLATSELMFAVLASAVAISTFLAAGFISISIIVFVVYCIANYFFLRTPIETKEHKVLLLLPIILFVVYVVWCVFSDNVGEAMSILMKKVWLFVIPLGFLLVNRGSAIRQRENILFAFLAACILCSLVCYAHALINIISNKSLYVHNDDRNYYYFSYFYLTDPIGISPIYLGILASMGFAIATHTPIIRKFSLRVLVVVYMAIFVILISAKTGILSMVLIMIVIALKTRKKTTSIIVVASFVLVFMLAIWKLPFLNERFVTSLKFDYHEAYGENWNSTTLRMAIWSCTLEAIARNPILGYGTGDGQPALENVYAEKEFSWATQERYNAHNEFFSTMLDTGVVGVAVLLLMFVIPLYRAVRTGDVTLISFLIVSFAVFATEAVLLRQKGTVFFCFFYSLLVMAGTEMTPKKT